MIRVLIGSLAGALAMFVVGFLFWATPLSRIGYSVADDTQNASIQAALAQNLQTGTGRYIVPSPESRGGAALYARGPVATVDYNAGGFSASDPATLIAGFVHEFVVVLIIGLTLLTVARRIGDFASRAKLVVGLCGAAALLITLSDPIFNHADWRFALYNFIACLAMLSAGGLVVARWFLPKPVSSTLH